MFNKRKLAGVLTVATFALLPALLSGCSQSANMPLAQGAPGAGSTPASPHGPQSAATMQSAIDKLKSDPSLTATQKQIMINEAQHETQKPSATQ